MPGGDFRDTLLQGLGGAWPPPCPWCLMSISERGNTTETRQNTERKRVGVCRTWNSSGSGKLEIRQNEEGNTR
jgi:hypothetical protein